MADAFIIDAVRTARGRRKGSLSETHPIDLLVAPMKAVVERNGVDPLRVEDVVVGCVTETGEQGSDLARSAVLAPGALLLGNDHHAFECRHEHGTGDPQELAAVLLPVLALGSGLIGERVVAPASVASHPDTVA